MNPQQQGPGGQAGPEQMLQVFQQKLGNLELTVNALMQALMDQDVVSEEQVNDQAQQIMQQIQEQQKAVQEAQQAQKEQQDE